jgi:peptidoglycan/xylan/chitin deacetylase (PgdA/CDA1 family)
MPRLALKVDADTYRGTCEGVPRLAELLRRRGAGATFLFSLGPDHTGRAIRRVLQPGFARTGLLRHYGLPTLLYGTLLPGPDIGRRCADILRAVRDAGFETGIRSNDHVKWQDTVERADADWTRREMELACARYQTIFGEPARAHGAAGWQMSRHAVRMTQRLGFAYSSDARGTHPFLPVMAAEIVACPQVPTTLPTLDELLGRDGLSAQSAHQHLLERTRHPPPGDHVFTLRAELEGMRLAPVFERLLDGWTGQGYTLTALGALVAQCDPETIPRHELVRGEIPERSGTLMLQGGAFLAED